jgi:hypothetical protein
MYVLPITFMGEKNIIDYNSKTCIFIEVDI